MHCLLKIFIFVFISFSSSLRLCCFLSFLVDVAPTAVSATAWKLVFSSHGAQRILKDCNFQKGERKVMPQICGHEFRVCQQPKGSRLPERPFVLSSSAHSWDAAGRTDDSAFSTLRAFFLLYSLLAVGIKAVFKTKKEREEETLKKKIESLRNEKK